MSLGYYSIPGLVKRTPSNPDWRQEKIVSVVCDYYKINLAAIQGKRRHRRIVVPRQMLVFFLKRFTNMTFKQIGAYIGGRDHTTAIHSINAINNLLDVDDDLMEQMHQIENKILS